jgi:hypothetical protein
MERNFTVYSKTKWEKPKRYSIKAIRREDIFVVIEIMELIRNFIRRFNFITAKALPFSSSLFDLYLICYPIQSRLHWVLLSVFTNRILNLNRDKKFRKTTEGRSLSCSTLRFTDDEDDETCLPSFFISILLLASFRRSSVERKWEAMLRENGFIVTPWKLAVCCFNVHH